LSDPNISIVIPVYNEELNIGFLLSSLMSQTLKPDEIIISDGGSTDQTQTIVESYQKDTRIIFFRRKGRCRGSGRNEGISLAKNSLVALIDSGIVPEKNWLAELYLSHKDSNKEVVYGAVRPVISSSVTRALGAFIVGKLPGGDSIFPSVGSMLVTKESWEKVGKFKESLTGEYVVEDLDFISKIDNSEIGTVINKQALSHWEIAQDFKEIFLRFSNYSQGTLENGLFKTWHLGTLRNTLIYTFLILLGAFLGLIAFFLLAFFHLARAISYLINTKWFIDANNTEKAKDLLYLCLVLIVIDLATYNGVARAVRRFFKQT
jgi:glycosyltransferase involved in cell wall biosynthesis